MVVPLFILAVYPLTAGTADLILRMCMCVCPVEFPARKKSGSGCFTFVPPSFLST